MSHPVNARARTSQCCNAAGYRRLAMSEDDELGDRGPGMGRVLGRVLALSDGIFAIAMTLLAFPRQVGWLDLAR